MSLTAIFEPCEEGGYHAFVPEIPGIHTQGETLDETRENLADAIGLWLVDVEDTKPPRGFYASEDNSLSDLLKLYLFDEAARSTRQDDAR